MIESEHEAIDFINKTLVMVYHKSMISDEL